MPAPIINVEGDVGGTVRVTVDVTEDDGSPADLTGYTGEMQVRAARERDAELLATGTVTITAATGRVVGTLAASVTEVATWRVGHYDIRIENAPLVEYVARGTIKLTETVTS